MPDGVGEHVLRLLQPSLLGDVVELCGGELVDLEAEQVDLPRPLAGRPTERGQLGLDHRPPPPRGPQRSGVDLAERVERGALRRSGEQALVVVLAVQVDEPGGGLGERADGARPTVDVGPGTTVRRDDTRQHELGVATDEAPVDARLGRTGTHDRGVGPPAQEQLQRLDEHRLAGARLAGDRRHARART